MATGSGIKVIVQAVAGNAFITIIKFIGYALTNSPSMLAEAVHSFADTLNQILLFIGLKQSTKEANREYSTGMGSASYVWNLVSAVGIFFLGFGVTFYHGMHSLFDEEHALAPVSWIAIAILIISFIIEFWVLVGAYQEVKIKKGNRSFIRYFRESDDPALLAVLLEDSVAVLGVVLALVAVVFGQIFQSTIFDSIIALIISMLLAFLAISLGIINGKLLIGKSLTLDQEEDIKKFISGLEQVMKVETLKTKIIGSGQIRLSLELELRGEAIIDNSSIVHDVKRLQDGESPTKVLYKASERMVRLTGSHINKIEQEIKNQFPSVTLIDLEVH